jgi:hypothetical protein
MTSAFTLTLLKTVREKVDSNVQILAVRRPNGLPFEGPFGLCFTLAVPMADHVLLATVDLVYSLRVNAPTKNQLQGVSL